MQLRRTQAVVFLLISVLAVASLLSLSAEEVEPHNELRLLVRELAGKELKSLELFNAAIAKGDLKAAFREYVFLKGVSSGYVLMREGSYFSSVCGYLDEKVEALGAEGLQFFQLNFDYEARELLANWEETEDISLLEQMIRVYRYTLPVSKALKELVAHYADNGNLARANFYFKEMVRLVPQLLEEQGVLELYVSVVVELDDTDSYEQLISVVQSRKLSDLFVNGVPVLEYLLQKKRLAKEESGDWNFPLGNASGSLLPECSVDVPETVWSRLAREEMEFENTLFPEHVHPDYDDYGRTRDRLGRNDKSNGVRNYPIIHNGIIALVGAETVVCRDLETGETIPTSGDEYSLTGQWRRNINTQEYGSGMLGACAYKGKLAYGLIGINRILLRELPGSSASNQKSKIRQIPGYKDVSMQYFELVTPPVLSQGRYLCCAKNRDGSNDRYVFCFDARSGELLWKSFLETKLPDEQHSGSSSFVLLEVIPVAGDGKLFIASRETVSAIDIDTGELIWQRRTVGGKGMLSAKGEITPQATLHFFKSENRLVVSKVGAFTLLLDAGNGEEIAVYQESLFLGASGGRAIVFVEEVCMEVDLLTGKSSRTGIPEVMYGVNGAAITSENIYLVDSWMLKVYDRKDYSLKGEIRLPYRMYSSPVTVIPLPDRILCATRDRITCFMDKNAMTRKFEKSVAQDEADPVPYYEYGIRLFHSGDYSKALRSFDEARGLVQNAMLYRGKDLSTLLDEAIANCFVVEAQDARFDESLEKLAAKCLKKVSSQAQRARILQFVVEDMLINKEFAKLADLLMDELSVTVDESSFPVAHADLVWRASKELGVTIPKKEVSIREFFRCVLSHLLGLPEVEKHLAQKLDSLEQRIQNEDAEAIKLLCRREVKSNRLLNLVSKYACEVLEGNATPQVEKLALQFSLSVNPVEVPELLLVRARHLKTQNEDLARQMVLDELTEHRTRIPRASNTNHSIEHYCNQLFPGIFSSLTEEKATHKGYKELFCGKRIESNSKYYMRVARTKKGFVYAAAGEKVISLDPETGETQWEIPCKYSPYLGMKLHSLGSKKYRIEIVESGSPAESAGLCPDDVIELLSCSYQFDEEFYPRELLDFPDEGATTLKVTRAGEVYKISVKAGIEDDRFRRNYEVVEVYSLPDDRILVIRAIESDRGLQFSTYNAEDGTEILSRKITGFNWYSDPKVFGSTAFFSGIGDCHSFLFTLDLNTNALSKVQLPYDDAIVRHVGSGRVFFSTIRSGVFAVADYSGKVLAEWMGNEQYCNYSGDREILTHDTYPYFTRWCCNLSDLSFLTYGERGMHGRKGVYLRSERGEGEYRLSDERTGKWLSDDLFSSDMSIIDGYSYGDSMFVLVSLDSRGASVNCYSGMILKISLKEKRVIWQTPVPRARSDKELRVKNGVLTCCYYSSFGGGFRDIALSAETGEIIFSEDYSEWKIPQLILGDILVSNVSGELRFHKALTDAERNSYKLEYEAMILETHPETSKMIDLAKRLREARYIQEAFVLYNKLLYMEDLANKPDVFQEMRAHRSELLPLIPSDKTVNVPWRKGITVDGDLSEWDDNSWQEIRSAIIFNMLKPEPGDLSASFQVAVSEDRLFLAVKVRDDHYQEDDENEELLIYLRGGDKFSMITKEDVEFSSVETEVDEKGHFEIEGDLVDDEELANKFVVTRDEQNKITSYELSFSFADMPSDITSVKLSAKNSMEVVRSFINNLRINIGVKDSDPGKGLHTKVELLPSMFPMVFPVSSLPRLKFQEPK